MLSQTGERSTNRWKHINGIKHF